MFALFAFTVATEHVVVVALAAVGAALLVALLCRKNPELIEQRRQMDELSKLLDKEGYPHLAKIASCMAFGDIVGAYKEGKFLVRQLRDPKTAAVLLEESFFLQLGKRLGQDADRPKILKALADFAAANPAVVKGAETVVAVATKAAVTAAVV